MFKHVTPCRLNPRYSYTVLVCVGGTLWTLLESTFLKKLLLLSDETRPKMYGIPKEVSSERSLHGRTIRKSPVDDDDHGPLRNLSHVTDASPTSLLYKNRCLFLTFVSTPFPS